MVPVETQETGVGVEVGGVGRGEGVHSPWVGKIWSRKWQLTPVFLPGKLHRQRNLAGHTQSMAMQSQTWLSMHMFTMFFFKKIFNLFIWLHWVLVVAHGNLDLRCRIGIFSCCVWALSCSVWDLVPWPGGEPRPLHWECGVLATGPPGKSLSVLCIWVYLRLQVSTASKFRLNCEAAL